MKLEADARIAFPRETVYAAYRDRLPELTPYLPNVRAITVQSREEAVGGNPARLDLVNLWEAKADIPSLLQGIVKPESLAWIDRAAWDDEAWACDWQIEPKIFSQNVRCSGRTSYRADGDATIQEIRGELEFDPSGIRGVPSFLAGRIAPTVEKFVVHLIRPNLLSVAEGLERFLKDQQGSAF